MKFFIAIDSELHLQNMKLVLPENVWNNWDLKEHIGFWSMLIMLSYLMKTRFH
jgi:hypothetical protein